MVKRLHDGGRAAVVVVVARGREQCVRFGGFVFRRGFVSSRASSVGRHSSTVPPHEDTRTRPAAVVVSIIIIGVMDGV